MDGRVFARDGWLGAVPENSKQYYGFTRFAIELNELDDDLRQQLPPTDTRFRPDQRFVRWILVLIIFFLCSYLELGQIDAAEKEKSRIEEAQRARANTHTAPKWFRSDGESFILIGDEDSSHSYWKKREENWTGIDFIQLW